MHHETSPSAPPEISERYLQDWRLVQKCLAGDRGAWLELVQTYESTVFFTVRHALLSRGAQAPESLVCDLQADILLALVKDNFRKLARYSGRCKLSHWLKVVSSNHTIDILRQRRPTISLNEDTRQAATVKNHLRDHTPSPMAHLQHQQQLTAMRGLYDELSREDRLFVELYLEQELPFEEVAAQMNTSIGAVYARKNRVRKKLTEMARRKGLLS